MNGLIKIVEMNDGLRRVCVTASRTLRMLINTWNLYVPLKHEVAPYNLHGRYRFWDRRKKAESLLIVIAGYKPQLWDAVLDRVRKYADPSMDICVVTSGKRVLALEKECERNGWSYLRTERNHVCLIQNLAIHLHPDARWIYKMDEDIFVTEGFVSRLKEVYLRAKGELRMQIGFVAPLIPVNGYGHVRVLEKTGLVGEWETRFGELAYTDGLHHHRNILSNPECAKFMWGSSCSELKDIDLLSAKFAAEGPSYRVCPIRFSIGLILFERSTWEDWGLFPVVSGTGMGEDEVHVCQYCQLHSKAMVIAENSLVGHLAFGPQTLEMLEYFKQR